MLGDGDVNVSVAVLFLVALATFGIGYCVNYFMRIKSPAVAMFVAIAAGVMGILALVALF